MVGTKDLGGWAAGGLTAQTRGLCAMSCSKSSICPKLCSVDRVSKIPESCTASFPRAAASFVRAADGSDSFMTRLAPSDWTNFMSVWEAVVITRTPDAVASWMAKAPISEAPLMMRIVCSFSPSSRFSDRARGRGRFRWFLWYSPTTARVTERGSVAASWNARESGMAETSACGKVENRCSPACDTLPALLCWRYLARPESISLFLVIHWSGESLRHHPLSGSEPRHILADLHNGADHILAGDCLSRVC
jgi:hypothetical protein